MREIPSRHPLVLLCALVVGLAACQRDPAAAGESRSTEAPVRKYRPRLRAGRAADVVERDPRYSSAHYPAVATRYPGLAAD